jgi:hypothetical protein
VHACTRVRGHTGSAWYTRPSLHLNVERFWPLAPPKGDLAADSIEYLRGYCSGTGVLHGCSQGTAALGVLWWYCRGTVGVL